MGLWGPKWVPDGSKMINFGHVARSGPGGVLGGSQEGPDRACQQRPLYPIHWAPDWPRRGPRRVPGGPKGSQIGQKSSNLMNFGHFEILGCPKMSLFDQKMTRFLTPKLDPFWTPFGSDLAGPANSSH
jgi:hypothetical protein